MRGPKRLSGRPALRVVLAYELESRDIEAEIEGALDDHPDLPPRREKVDVAREHEGLAVGLVSGSKPPDSADAIISPAYARAALERHPEEAARP